MLPGLGAVGALPAAASRPSLLDYYRDARSSTISRAKRPPGPRCSGHWSSRAEPVWATAERFRGLAAIPYLMVRFGG